MGRRVGQRAAVLGGGMGGLLAARVLAESFAEVVVVDRDELGGTRDHRRGVPHGRHAHGLVALGQQILEELFPGLTEELTKAGATPGDFNGDIRWYLNGRRLRPAWTGLLSVPATRPLLEHHVRMRVRDIPNVVFLDRHDILGLTATPGGERVTGVRVRPRGGDAAAQTVEADLVVDSTGRGSRTPAWLEELGYARPEEERLKIGLAYTTRHYRLRTDPFDGDLAIILAATPRQPRGALLYRVPGSEGHVELSLTGMLGDHPPTDPDGFLAFARSLPTPHVYEAVRDAEPLDDPVMFRFPASVRRRYERLRRLPERLLVIGDAVCSLNPIYAQGMTVTAFGALTLRRHLRSGTVPEPRAFFEDLAAAIDSPWDFSITSDLGYPGVEGGRTLKVRLVNAYVSRLQDAAVHDPVLSAGFVRVAGLVDPPEKLMRPGTVLRVLRGAGRRRRFAAAAARTEELAAGGR